jgi:pyruvate dehydrogenase E1 component alpha subunit
MAATARTKSAATARGKSKAARAAKPPAPETPPAPSEKTRLALYDQMVRLRYFEKRAHDLFLQNLVKGTSHLALGQEAIAAAFGVAMRPDDYTFATYRGHAHTLARGVPMAPVMAELLGRENGLMAGKGGSMHLTSVEHGVMGSYAIVGAHLPIACGAAWSAQYRGSGQVAAVFFGDGATNIGAFHEALNFAAIWALPVVFICENNLYMEYTRTSTITAVAQPAAGRAAAYGLEPIVADGNDADAMYHVATAALDQARDGGGPTLIEALTYRQGGHSRADPGKYRPQAEVDEWLARDPIPVYRARLIEAGTDHGALDAIEKAAAEDVDAATEQAKAGAEPGADLLMKDVWADGGASWRN